MRVKGAGFAVRVLMTLTVLVCGGGVTVSTPPDSESDSGNCAGCMRNADDSLFSFVVRSDADFDSLITRCFLERTREDWLPPRPSVNEELVYVSLKGSGCEGCLDIVNVYESSDSVLVGVEGGFRGECEMLMMRGAWVLVPRSDKRISLQFREMICSDDT